MANTNGRTTKKKSAPAPSGADILKALPRMKVGPKQRLDFAIGQPAKAARAARVMPHLIFDGYSLVWKGDETKTWTAFSGAPNEAVLESVKDVGPTPQGHYTVDPKTIQKMGASDEEAWGRYRVWLQPLRATVKRMTDCFNVIRTEMYIHGGKNLGTLGCIEINDDAEEKDFFETLAAYGKPVDVEVKYTGAREKKYEDLRCPY